MTRAGFQQMPSGVKIVTTLKKLQRSIPDDASNFVTL
jgi:hypothetical protein